MGDGWRNRSHVENVTTKDISFGRLLCGVGVPMNLANFACERRMKSGGTEGETEENLENAHQGSCLNCASS